MPDLDRIRTALEGFEPDLIGEERPRRAAVALVLRDRAEAGPELLFIERASHDRDPWSGQMAFPGGRLETADASLRHAAERETLEEVGLSLAAAAHLGRLDDLEGRNRGRPAGIVVSAFVYHHPDPGPLRTNYEVESAFWVPVRRLRETLHHVDYEHPELPGPRFPGIVVGEPHRHVVWGLTYRFVERFLEITGFPLPDRWQELRAGG